MERMLPIILIYNNRIARPAPLYFERDAFILPLTERGAKRPKDILVELVYQGRNVEMVWCAHLIIPVKLGTWEVR